MTPRFTACGVLLAALAMPATAVTIYDPSLGTLPSAQGWTLGTSGSTGGSQTLVSNQYQLTTTAADAGYGNGRFSPVPLNTSTGYALTFDLKVVSETHADSSRAGFSVIAIGATPSQSIEVAFWSDHIWVYGYNAALSDPFFHGSDVAFNTTAATRHYTLSTANGLYRLQVDGTTLLSGALVDYTPSGIFPYVVPNTLFIGDDTSRGSSVTLMGPVSVAAVPELASALLLAVGLAALAWRRSRHTA